MKDLGPGPGHQGWGTGTGTGTRTGLSSTSSVTGFFAIPVLGPVWPCAGAEIIWGNNPWDGTSAAQLVPSGRQTWRPTASGPLPSPQHFILLNSVELSYHFTESPVTAAAVMLGAVWISCSGSGVFGSHNKQAKTHKWHSPVLCFSWQGKAAQVHWLGQKQCRLCHCREPSVIILIVLAEEFSNERN